MIKDKCISRTAIDRIDHLPDRFRNISDISALYLFGSQIDNPTPLSDIDIAILGPAKFSFEKMMDLQHEISAVLGTIEIDLIDLRSVNPDFAYKVIRYGKNILLNDELILADFAAYVCDRVFDYRYHIMECINS